MNKLKLIGTILVLIFAIPAHATHTGTTSRVNNGPAGANTNYPSQNPVRPAGMPTTSQLIAAIGRDHHALACATASRQRKERLVKVSVAAGIVALCLYGFKKGYDAYKNKKDKDHIKQA